ncbi:MAG: amidohydrolase family protein [Lachnospiraceae bacterium]|nr:amidohydrolase family protein [Lachnospiraceae bacterium]
MCDLIIRNSLTRKTGKDLVDIAITDGKIAEIKTKIEDKANNEIDAKGNLVTESYVNGHLHLDKVYTLDRAGQKAIEEYNEGGMGNALTSIASAAEFKSQYDEKWIIENVRKALDLSVKYGNTHIRAFADVDSKAKLEGVKALLKAKEEYKNKVTLEVVAFPQDGVAREPGAYEYIEESLKLGADVVGGIPWIEFSREDEQDHVDKMCDLAKKYNKDISMLCDDVGDAEERTFEMLIKKVIEMGWEGRATGQHCRAMMLYPENQFRKLCALLKRARMGVISDPQTGPLHAKVLDLIKEGIPVGLGQDDINDAYYTFGQNNMLEVAFLGAHLLRMCSDRDLELVYDMVTTMAAKVLNMKGHELVKGGIADLVILKEKDIKHAIWYHEEPIYVIKNGKIIKEVS